MDPECYPHLLRRPLVGLALAFIAGTSSAVLFRGAPSFWVGGATALLLLIALLFHIWHRFNLRRPVTSVFDSSLSILPRLFSGMATLVLYFAVAGAAWFSASLRLDDPSTQALSARMTRPRESVELEGIVADDPVSRPAWNNDRQVWSFPLRVESIRQVLAWEPARGTVQVILTVPSEDERRPQYGDCWRLAGVLTDNARFPEDEFAANSSRPVLDWLNRRYTFRTDPDAAVCLVPCQGLSLMGACFQLRQQCAALLALGIGHRPDVVGLLRAILLGYRQELPEKLRNDFVATGTYHIFAISGQHVAILALFIIVVLQSYRVSRVTWFLYVAPILVVFTLSTGMSSSAVRGCLMALLCFLGPLVGRKPDIPSAMALAALIILAVDPFHLFDYGFLLSFVAVSGLIVLCPPMLRRVAPALEPDPFRLQPEPKPVHWSRRAFRAVAFLFVTSLAAWLVTTPLVARWFNLVSPVALLANLVVIPITTLVLLAGCLAILFGWAVPVLGEIFNFTNVALVSFLLWITDLMARIPYGHVFVRSPPLWSLAVWYGTLAMWVGWRQRAWCWIIAPVLLALSLGAGFLGSRNAVVLDVINWGDGPVCFVNGIGGDDLLINPGSRYHVRKVIRHLRRQGVDGLKAVVLAGAGSSRAGGTPDILQTMAVGELWIPSSAGRSVTLREAREAAREQGVAIRNMTNGATIRLRGGTTWSFLFTPADSSAALTGKPLLAWRLQRGARSVLCADNVSSPMTAGMSALARSLIPTVLIENRMDPDPARSSRAAWPAAINSEWRIICTRLLLQDEPPGTPASSHIIRLAPGQGVRIHLKDTIVRVEQF